MSSDTSAGSDPSGPASSPNEPKPECDNKKELVPQSADNDPAKEPSPQAVTDPPPPPVEPPPTARHAFLDHLIKSQAFQRQEQQPPQQQQQQQRLQQQQSSFFPGSNGTSPPSSAVMAAAAAAASALNAGGSNKENLLFHSNFANDQNVDASMPFTPPPFPSLYSGQNAVSPSVINNNRVPSSEASSLGGGDEVSSSTSSEEAAVASSSSSLQPNPAACPEQPVSPNADYVGLALKQWSVYLGNVLLNFIHKECKNNGGGGGQCSSEGPSTGPASYCPCCHYHTQIASGPQQQQQAAAPPSTSSSPSTSTSLHHGYYNYAANFSSSSSPFFAQQQMHSQQHGSSGLSSKLNYFSAARPSPQQQQQQPPVPCVQGRDPSVEFTQEIVEESEDERAFDEMMSGGDAVPPIELPATEISRLEEIAELVNSCLPSPLRREKLAVAIENEGYIKRLLDVFHQCEDLENREGLCHIYEIFKNIFHLNKNALFEVMFTEDIIFDVVGCLEYDPALQEPKKHREYLKSIANFHQVIKINNTELLSKIHQTYRVQYIQDVVLPTPTVFEENCLSTLSSFIFFNKVEIVSLIQDDEKFLTELFAQLTDEATEDCVRKESVLFLKEFCTFSQTLQPQSRENFFKTLNTLGILPALEITLASENRVTKSASIDILIFIVDFSPCMVREYMLQQLSSNGLLMNVIIEQMSIDSDPEMGGAVQLVGIIRTLLDPENMLASVNKSEKTDFLNYFYKHCMHVFLGPLMSNTAESSSSRMDPCTVQLLSLILELLSFCVEHHTYHIKNYILHKDLLKRILVLMGSKHTFLVLCALRFMRKIVALKDEFYNRYIIRGNLFAPVIDAFISNDGRYNLLDSAILEMFEFIKLEDIKSLCTHVVESFGPTLDKITYVQTFKALKTRYDQHQDRMRERPQSQLESVGSILRPGRFRRDQRDLDEDEEMWFNDDDYEGNGSGGAGPAEAANGAANVMGVGATAATLSAQQQQQQLQNGNGAAAVAKAANNGLLHELAGEGDGDDEDDDEDDSEEQQNNSDNAKKGGLVDYDGDSDDDETNSDPAEQQSPSASTAATTTATTTTSLATSTSSSSGEGASTSNGNGSSEAVAPPTESSSEAASSVMDTSSSSDEAAQTERTESIEEPAQPAPEAAQQAEAEQQPEPEAEKPSEEASSAAASNDNPSSSHADSGQPEEQQNRDTASTASEAVAAPVEDSAAQQQPEQETSSESVSTTEEEKVSEEAPTAAASVSEVEGKEAEAASSEENVDPAQEATEESVSEGPAAKRPRTE